MKGSKPPGKALKILISLIILFIIGFIYYYITLPAINIHAKGFWNFIIVLFAILTIVIGFMKANLFNVKPKGNDFELKFNKTALKNKLFKVSLYFTLALIIIYLIGSLLSSPIVNASKYRELIDISEGDFQTDIKQISYDKIPILDKDSAALLGQRKMGNMVEYVSQFEVSNDYTQINYNSTPTRVTPLKYGSFFKWLNNRKDGIPAYIQIDMTTQNVECIKLEQGIKYSESELFGRNIHRYLRFKYPTYIFGKLSFEIDDNGTPFWICPVKDFTIGLFGGEAIRKVVIVNAVTGEIQNYDIKEVPTWVDRVYDAELLISYYDYYGTLKHGYLNTLLSQKDCLKTTAGYNYIALDDDVWVYTGVTSVGADESNVGFVLMNQRTAETKYYPISGAEEYSAMASAQGQVQHLGYIATFPLFLNVANEPTYFIALKDEAGLVKKYAMVNIAKYNIVAIGDSVTECEKTYLSLLKSNSITVPDTNSFLTTTGSISKIAEAVIDGTSHYYLILDGNDEIFDVNLEEHLDIIKYNVGDIITLSYLAGSPANAVQEIK